MACGLPVLGMPVRDILDVIDDGVDGLIAPGTNPEALCTSLRRLLEDGDLRARLGSEARRHAEPEYSMESVLQKELAVYREIGVIQ
jgi:glycosyltransferase involved in cell wall biosynthesis